MVKIFKREINFTNHEENICSSAITIGAKKGGHPPRPLQSARERESDTEGGATKEEIRPRKKRARSKQRVRVSG